MKFNYFSQKRITSRTFSKKKRLMFVLEVFLLLIVTGGTLFSLSNLKNISLREVATKVKGIISIQKQDQDEKKDISLEEKINRNFANVIPGIVSIDTNKKDFSTIKTRDKTTVIISNLYSLEEQAETLQNILSKAKIEERNIALVDFRFDKLIVRYKNKQN